LRRGSTIHPFGDGVFAGYLELVVDVLIQKKAMFHNSGSNTENQAFIRFTEFVEIYESVRPDLTFELLHSS
jgi:hypothetical protein